MADNELTSDPWDDLGSPTPEGTDPESPASPIQPPAAESTDVPPGLPPTPPPPPASPGLAEPEAPVMDVDSSVSDIDSSTPASEVLSDPAIANQPDLAGSELAAPDLAGGEFDVPELDVPELDVPELDVPELDVPDLEIPDLDLPDLDAAHGLEIPDLDFGEASSAPALSAESEAPLEQLDAPAEVTDRSTGSRYSPLLAATGLFGSDSSVTDESTGSEAAEGGASEAIEPALANEDADDFQLGSSEPPSVYGELEAIAGIEDGEASPTDGPFDGPADEPADGPSDDPSIDPSRELEEPEGPSGDLQVDESGERPSELDDEVSTEGDEETVTDSSDDSAMDFAALLGDADAIGLGGDEPDLTALAALVAGVEPVVLGEDSAAPELEEIGSMDTDDWLVDADDLSDDEAGFDIGITWGSGEEVADAEEDDTVSEDGPPDLEVPDLDLPDLDSPDLDTPDFQVPDLDLPDLQVPDLDLPEVEIPEAALAELGVHDVGIPDLEMPDTDVPGGDVPESDMPDWPDAEVPGVDMPESDMPESDVPDWPEVDFPEVEVPEVDVPEVEVPEVEVPEVEVPEVDVPEVEVPEADVPEVEVPEADPAEGDPAEGDVPEVDMLGAVRARLDAPDVDSAEPYHLESDFAGDAIASSDVDSSSEAAAGASPVGIFDDLEDVSAESMLSGGGEAWGARWREAAQGWVEDESGASTWRPIITTSPTLSEWDVDTYLGVVIGDTSADAEGVTAEEVAAARETSTRHMVDEALARGAHAVVGVSYTVQPIGATVMVTATGTAVTLKAESSG